jgi:hypothetical protein
MFRTPLGLLANNIVLGTLLASGMCAASIRQVAHAFVFVVLTQSRALTRKSINSAFFVASLAHGMNNVKRAALLVVRAVLGLIAHRTIFGMLSARSVSFVHTQLVDHVDHVS